MTDPTDVGNAILQNTVNSFLNDTELTSKNIWIPEANLLVEVMLTVSSLVCESLLQ